VKLTRARDRQLEPPVFRSDHPLRKHLVRIGAAVLAVLFVAWAVAMAAGILGFGALPGIGALPGVSESEPEGSSGPELSAPASAQPNRSTRAPGPDSRNRASGARDTPSGAPRRTEAPGSSKPDTPTRIPAGAAPGPASVPTTPTAPATRPATPGASQRPTSPPGQSDPTSPPGQSVQQSPPGQSVQQSPPGQSDL
jgi:hypothetical protein